MYAKIELTKDNAKDLLTACVLHRMSEDEIAATLSYIENFFDDGSGDILSIGEIDDFIITNADDIVSELGYEDEEHFDYCKDNDLESGDYAYRKDGEWYAEDDLREKWEEVENACYEAMCDAPFYDFDEYVENVFECLETP